MPLFNREKEKQNYVHFQWVNKLEKNYMPLFNQ